MGKNGLIVSVGGSPEPVIKAIKLKNPDNILFVVSGDSKSTVEDKILRELDYVPQYKFLEISEHQHIGSCYREIRDGMDGWLRERDLKPNDVYVDITGGTKAMSAALALAAVERFHTYTYVGGDERSEAGVGIVIDGSEKVISTQNPLGMYPVRDLERANWLLSKHHANAAAHILREASKKCAERYKTRLESFADLAEALGEADSFRFTKADKTFGLCRKALEYTLDYSIYKQMLSLHQHWEAVRDQMKSDGKTPGQATLLELLANAERRASQARYDDAVGRLYRAVELRGQQLVKKAFGAELGMPSRDSFPLGRREEVLSELGEPDDDVYKLGVKKLYAILKFSDDESLCKQAGVYDPVSQHLSIRNNSLLAHGLQPVSKTAFDKFWTAVLDTLEIREDDVPRWPKWDLKLK